MRYEGKNVNIKKNNIEQDLSNIFLYTPVSVQCLCVFSRISFIDKGWREMLSMMIYLPFFIFFFQVFCLQV